MKNAVILLLLSACVAGYIRTQQPQLWNQLLSKLQAQATAGTASQARNTAPTAEGAASEPIFITPDSSTLAPGKPASSKQVQLSRTSIPSSITTLSGITYTGCILSRITPDGISFIHSAGVAKVLFTDLDPRFAATFGYNPDVAQKYEDDEARAEAASDARRNAAVAASAPLAPSSASAPVDTTEPPPDADSGTPETAPPAPDPEPVPAAPARVPKLSPGEKAAIQAQIDVLNSDIAFMRREESRATPSDTHGGYPDKIAEEHQKILQLQAKLADD